MEQGGHGGQARRARQPRHRKPKHRGKGTLAAMAGLVLIGGSETMGAGAALVAGAPDAVNPDLYADGEIGAAYSPEPQARAIAPSRSDRGSGGSVTFQTGIPRRVLPDAKAVPQDTRVAAVPTSRQDQGAAARGSGEWAATPTPSGPTPTASPSSASPSSGPTVSSTAQQPTGTPTPTPSPGTPTLTPTPSPTCDTPIQTSGIPILSSAVSTLTGCSTSTPTPSASPTPGSGG